MPIALELGSPTTIVQTHLRHANNQVIWTSCKNKAQTVAAPRAEMLQTKTLAWRRIGMHEEAERIMLYACCRSVTHSKWGTRRHKLQHIDKQVLHRRSILTENRKIVKTSLWSLVWSEAIAISYDITSLWSLVWF